MLRVPGRPISGIPVHQSDVPSPDKIPILGRPIVRCILATAPLLRDARSTWAIGGDAGEVIMGVNVPADHLELLTTEDGCYEISERLAEGQSAKPQPLERVLEREAPIGDGSYQVRTRSVFAQFRVDGVMTEVHGGMRFKVGEWDWGDPLDFEPAYSYIVGERVPILPLRLKSELYLGLGWLDRAEKITRAVSRGQHQHGRPGAGGAER